GGLVVLEGRARAGVARVGGAPPPSPEGPAGGPARRGESVVGVRGVVRPRPAETVNPDLPTGTIEIVAERLGVLNTSRPTPFPVDDAAEVSETHRLKYRYLDLRRPRVQDRLRLRHEVVRRVHEHLDRAGFIEVETPILTRSTPEGARDYLVPSRVQRGSFYAL